MEKIGLLLIATNKYIDFVQPLITSADKYFMAECDVTYYVFTDHKNINLQTSRNVVILDVEHKPFPHSTLMRYGFFHQYNSILSKEDYLYYSDVDMLFVDSIGDEILGSRVATRHPGYYDKYGIPAYYAQACGVWNPIEENPNTLACIKPDEKVTYFAGGFNGGTSLEFLKMSEVLFNNITSDLSRGVIAKWHDESHFNRYMLDNNPSVVLSPSYCYGENMNIPYKKKLIALDKNHEYYRS